VTNFIDDVLARRTTLDAIDDYFDRWHNGEDGRSLSQFLGLSTEEYAAWIADVDPLTRIIAERSAVCEAKTARAGVSDC